MAFVLRFLWLIFMLLLPCINAQSEVNEGVESEKYKLIKIFLDQYKRPFTLLDIASPQGYYPLKIAHEYDAVCVMLEVNEQGGVNSDDYLLNLCKANKHLSNLILLNKLFTAQDLQHLSECEHFDLVLVMNVVHRFGNNWQEALDAILNMGDYVVIEISLHDEFQKIIEEYVLKKAGTILGDVLEQTVDSDVKLYIIESHKKYLQRKTWLLPKLEKNNYIIESSFSEKKLTKTVYWPRNAIQVNEWVPGINMLTFKMCNGIYPAKKTIKSSLLQLKESPHTDWMINNMVLQGNDIVWIDVDDLGRTCGALIKPTRFSEEGMKAHQMLFDLDDPKKVEHFFWHTLIWLPIARRHRVRALAKLLLDSSIVFDIVPENNVFIETCLGHGSKVICFDISGQYAKDLYKKFEYEDVVIVPKEVLENNLDIITLDAMIDLYKPPYLCNIHLPENKVYSLLEGLTQPIPYIIFKFNIHALFDLEQCLKYLENLEYTSFNFSLRDIPLFILDTNIHTGSKKEWAESADALLKELKQCVELDYDGQNLWGYIYAHKKNMNINKV